MNRNTVLTSALAVCLVILAASAALGVNRVIGFTGLRYSNADKYSSGGTEIKKPVKSLDIHWADGSVTIAYHAKDTVEISETAPGKLSDKTSIHWWLDGTTLRIRHTRSGVVTRRSLKKALTVTLPENSKYELVEISATSADVTVPALTAESIDVNLSSGDLVLEQNGTADTIELNSTSGEVDASLEKAKNVSVTSTSGTISLAQSAKADKIRLNSSSGDIHADVENADEIEATSTSGEIRMSLKETDHADISSSSGRVDLEAESIGKTEIGNTSGGVTLKVSAFEDLQVSTTSGNVSATLPAKPGFQAKISTGSGSFDSSIALKQDGKHYSCGDESAKLEIKTTSGDIRLSEGHSK